MDRIAAFILGAVLGFLLGACSTAPAAPEIVLRDATARIDVLDPAARASRGHGTAFAVGAHHWATAAHVVADRQFFEIDGMHARVVFVDVPNDTAILYRPVPTETWLDVDCSYAWPDILSPLTTYGYPNASRPDMRQRAVYHRGEVASDHRQQRAEGYRFVVTGATIVPGASGSAWVDEAGVVRGIVTDVEMYLLPGGFMGQLPLLTDTSLAAPTFALCTGLAGL